MTSEAAVTDMIIERDAESPWMTEWSSEPTCFVPEATGRLR